MKEYFKKSDGVIDQIKQLTSVTWAGDLISKSITQELTKNGLVVSEGGFYILSRKGLAYLRQLGFLRI